MLIGGEAVVFTGVVVAADAVFVVCIITPPDLQAEAANTPGDLGCFRSCRIRASYFLPDAFSSS